MAEWEDDEGFGDFKFVSSPPPSVNGPDFSSKNNNDDDDWGDFINSTALSRTESLPPTQFDPFGISSPPTQPDSAPSRVESLWTRWNKPSGALPLSIFGEEEEEPEVVDAPFNGPNGLFSSPIKVDNVKEKGSNLNDLIANLYKQDEKSKDGNGTRSAVNGEGMDLKNAVGLSNVRTRLDTNGQNWQWNGLNLNSNGLSSGIASSNGSDLKWDGLNSGSNGSVTNSNTSSFDRKAAILSFNALNEVNLSSTGVGSNPNVLKLDSNGLNSSLVNGHTEIRNGDNDDDHGDDDGWEFKVAESKTYSIEEDKAQNRSMLNSSASTISWNVLGTIAFNSNVNGGNSNASMLNVSSVDKNEESSDHDGWEFKVAESDACSGVGSAKVGGRVQENSEGVEYAFGFGNHTNGPSDLFVTSGGISDKPGEWDLKFGFSPSFPPQSNQDSTKHGLISSSVDVNISSDKTSWAFNEAFSQTRLEDKEEPKADAISPRGVEGFSLDIETQRDEGGLQQHKGALPLSIFGSGEVEIDDPLRYPEVSTSKPASSNVGIKDPSSNMSINDLISSLYGQAEKSGSVNQRQNPSENELSSTQTVLDPNQINMDDSFNDDSWEFKGVFSGTKAENQNSELDLENAHKKYSTKGEIIDYVDFYSKLKDELCFVARCHLENEKEVCNPAAPGEDAEIKALEKEIQDLFDKLHKDSTIFKEFPKENLQSTSISLHEFSNVLQEEKLQVLELEYHLSERLSMAEKDLKSAIELLKHVVSMLKILKLGSTKDQSTFVSTWSKIASVCAQELKHGASIWKQALHENIHSQILSNPQGRQHIIALGEIYRVLEIIGSSARLYKPWVLFGSADPEGIFALLKECSTIWSCSGLEQALQSMADPPSLEYDIKTLLSSIENVRDLDADELYNQVFSGQEPTCQLSVVTSGTVPGTNMVVWNGEHYFLPLANLWANLISCDPPTLPHINTT